MDNQSSQQAGNQNSANYEEGHDDFDPLYQADANILGNIFPPNVSLILYLFWSSVKIN